MLSLGGGIVERESTENYDCGKRELGRGTGRTKRAETGIRAEGTVVGMELPFPTTVP
jgi:hypothetical protein